MVMQSLERTMAEGIIRVSRTAVIARLFPVASTPWMQSVTGLENSGCFLGLELANLGG